MWLVFVSGAAEPLFYLLSVGVGIGGLIGTVTGPGGQPVPYREFVAPGLLAVSALNGALNDSTFNVYGRLKFEKLYDAVLATPLGARDVALAEIGWARAARHDLLGLVPDRDGGDGPDRLAVGAARAAGRGPDQLRDRRGRGGLHHLHEDLAGLRLRLLVSLPLFLFSGHVLPAVASTRTSSA